MKSRKFILGFILLLAFTLLITGCSSNKSMQSDTAPSEDMDSSRNDVMHEETGESTVNESLDEGSNFEPDKIITTVYIEMQTKDFLPTTENLNDLIQKYKGYIEQSNISYNDYVYSTSLKYSNYSIRIPKENLDKFIDEVVQIGNIISQNQDKQNITKQYRDTESRLRVLETKEERILALLEKAEKMEDIIVLENQLSDLIYEKENLTQNLTNMDDQVNYSTVNLNLEEVAKLTPGGNSKTPFLEKLKTAFEDSFYFFTRNIGDFVIGLVYFLPYGLILAVIGYIVYRFIWKKRRDKE